jgi:hypothetical protein
MTTVTKFKLLDGTEIPWLGWGNGSGKVSTSVLQHSMVLHTL